MKYRLKKKTSPLKVKTSLSHGQFPDDNKVAILAFYAIIFFFSLIALPYGNKIIIWNDRGSVKRADISFVITWCLNRYTVRAMELAIILQMRKPASAFN